MSAPKSCIFCHAPFATSDTGQVPSGHVCKACGAPQPVTPEEDYFSLLGTERGFKQDPVRLEKRFYDISRELHPDRFAAGADRKWKTISVERMSAVNRAYQTLTKADRLREYLLTLEGIIAPGPASPNGKTQIPAELAEEWFELQDAVMSEPSEAEEKLLQFEKDLRQRSEDLRGKIQSLESEYDHGTLPEARKDVLRKIEKLSLDGQYLKSMERDLLKLKTRLGI